MRICVIDGQGGGIGSVLIKAIRDALGEEVEILALGTNAAATSQMMKARANKGASGENAICFSVREADVIAGPLGVILANAMMGEVSPRIAEAVSSSPALKLLLPLTRERVEVVGMIPEPLPHLVEKLIKRLKELIKDV
jgi:hypothetical protein